MNPEDPTKVKEQSAINQHTNTGLRLVNRQRSELFDGTIQDGTAVNLADLQIQDQNHSSNRSKYIRKKVTCFTEEMVSNYKISIS